MMTKRGRDAAAINALGPGGPEPQYVGFFDCFNQQLSYEAHEVLEPLWLAQRRDPDGAFYKGLIQLAGAFVHLQKGRRQPAAALLRLAQANLQLYPAVHHQLELAVVLGLIRDWQRKLETEGLARNPFLTSPAPKLHLRQS